jgi:hypothetical protein
MAIGEDDDVVASLAEELMEVCRDRDIPSHLLLARAVPRARNGAHLERILSSSSSAVAPGTSPKLGFATLPMSLALALTASTLYGRVRNAFESCL